MPPASYLDIHKVSPPAYVVASPHYQMLARRAYNDSSSISTLPTEVLALIFSHTLEKRPSLASALLCSHVCHHWRKVAWSSSELWSTICFSFQYSEYDVPIRSITSDDIVVLKEWMGRSGPSRPLTLAIKCSIFSFRLPRVCPFVEPTKLLTFLIDHCHRWERLELCLQRSWFARIQGFTFPILESISFTAFCKDPADLLGTTIQHWLPHWNIPSLHSVELHGIEPHKTLLPWSQLQHITICETWPLGFLEILPLCNQAVEIKVELVWSVYEWFLRHSTESRFARATLPLLERLCILCEEPAFAVSLLTNTFAPRLQCLGLNLFRAKLEPLPPAIRKFVNSCKLRKLVLEVDYQNSYISKDEARDFCDRLADKTLIPIELGGS